MPHHLASLPLNAVTNEKVKTVALKRIEGDCHCEGHWPRASDLSQEDSLLLGAVLAV